MNNECLSLNDTEPLPIKVLITPIPKFSTRILNLLEALFLIVPFPAKIIGFLLLIIPGLYLSAAWFLGIYLLVDKGLSPMDALGKSRELVHEVGFWKVFITVFALSLGIQLISLIPVLGLIAMLFLYPLIVMVYVAIYEHAIKGDAKAIDADFQ